MRRPKKRSSPRRTARKNEEDSSLRFFIFEILSQRFLQNIFRDFHFLEKNEKFQNCENLWKCFVKISVTKFRKWKIWDCYLLSFFVLFVMVYSVFSVDAFFTEKISKQNRLFWLFFRLPTTLEGPGAMNMASKNTVPKNPDVPKPQIENTIETFDTNNQLVAVFITSKSVKTHLAAKKFCGW